MIRPLRIFLCCQQDLRPHALPAYRFWAGYFRQAFAEAGHVCLEAPGCDWAEGLLPLAPDARQAWLSRTWETAVTYLRQEHARAPVDFFLSYLFPGQVLPPALAEIRRLGIPCVNFFCDNIREFRRVPEAFRPFDLHWVPEYRAVALYQEAGLPWLSAPMACWIPPAWRETPSVENASIAFVGTRDEQRESLFAEVLNRGLSVELYGVGWMNEETPASSLPPAAVSLFTRVRRQWEFGRQQGWAALARKSWSSVQPPARVTTDFTPTAKPAQIGKPYWTTLRESCVCLGVNRYPSWRFPFARPDTYSRLRDLEAPMAGACYLTEWADGLDQLYEIGREVEIYRDATELVGRARELAADAPRRQRMRRAAQQRALRDHTIARTIERIAERLGCART